MSWLAGKLGYVPADEHQAAVGRSEEMAEKIKGLEQEVRLLNLQVNRLKKERDAQQKLAAAPLESIVRMTPAFSDESGVFTTAIHIDYQRFMDFVNAVGGRGTGEYDALFHNLFFTIKSKFDALMDMGPQAWLNVTRQARRYDQDEYRGW